MESCRETGCDKKPKARGLCSTHYNRTRPNNHRKVLVPCDWCGSLAPKYARNKQRYGSQYCSVACRDYGIRKTWPTCDLPQDHWGRWYGASSSWKPATSRPTFFANICDDCGASFVERAYGVPSSYCSMTCTKRVSKRRRRAREHGAPGQFTLRQLMQQFVKQARACAYCCQPIEGSPDPEHVTPLSRGGRNDMSNIVAACRSCNTDKGDLTLEEWAMDRSRRGLVTVDTSLSKPEFTHLYRTPANKPAWRDRTPLRTAA